MRQNKTSIYLGVHYCTRKKKFHACTKFGNTVKFLGAFEKEKDAAIARDSFLISNGITNRRMNFGIDINIKIKEYKLIPLTQNKMAKVSIDRFGEVNKHVWYAAKQKGNDRWYAVRRLRINGIQKSQTMQEYIIGKTCGMVIDHRDGNGLNNQDNNLRFCTSKENNQNKLKSKNKTCKYKGVVFYPKLNSYKCTIRIDGKNKHLGYYKNSEDAALAYNASATENYKEFANLNNIKTNE